MCSWTYIEHVPNHQCRHVTNGTVTEVCYQWIVHSIQKCDWNWQMGSKTVQKPCIQGRNASKRLLWAGHPTPSALVLISDTLGIWTSMIGLDNTHWRYACFKSKTSWSHQLSYVVVCCNDMHNMQLIYLMCVWDTFACNIVSITHRIHVWYIW